MASLEQLQKALRNADAAGDTAAAKQIAAAIRAQQPAKQESLQAEFDRLPLWQKPIKAADDILRVGADALTFGGIDHLRAMMGTQPDVETARKATEEARVRAGGAGTVAAVGSAMLPAILTSGMTAAPQAGNIVRTGLASLEGAAWNGLDALGHGEDVLDAQVKGLAFGAGGKLAADGIGMGLDKMMGAFTPKPTRVTPQELRLSKNRAYNAVEDEGVEYTAPFVDDLMTRMDDTMKDSWPTNQPLSRGAHKRAKKTLPGAPRKLTEVDQARQAIRRDATSTKNRSEDEFGRRMLKDIDTWMDDADASSVTSRSGNPEAGLDKLRVARGENSKLEKVELLDSRVGRAKRAAERNLYSGEDSTLKANIGGILDDPNLRRMYSADELAKMEEVNRGTGLQRIMRQAGRMAPGGGLSWAASGAAGGGALMAGLPPDIALAAGTAPSVLGILAKKGSERSTSRSVEELLDMVSTGKSLKSPPVMSTTSKRELGRLLMMLGVTSE